MEWQYFQGEFEYRKAYADQNSPWAGHIFFAYDLVRNLKPKKIVELGTSRGTSFYSMLQALKDEQLETLAFAVDSWEGDIHSGTIENGYDPEGFYNLVKETIRTYYPKQNARLLKMYFSEAVHQFEDGSIDILHIDGLHTYEAVKEDYETWKSKLAKDSVILFHDTKVADFGVWKQWDNVKKDYSKDIAFSFNHSHGLGVAVKGEYKGYFKNIISSLRTFLEYYSVLYENSLLSFESQHYKEQIEDVTLSLSKLNNEFESLNIENSVLLKENGLLKERIESLLEENENFSAKANLFEQDLIKKNALLNSMLNRKFIKLYRKIVQLIDRDIVKDV